MQQGTAPQNPTNVPRLLTTMESAHVGEAKSENLTHGSIPAMGGGVLGLALQDLRIGWLEVFAAWRLHLDEVTVAYTWSISGTVGFEAGGQ